MARRLLAALSTVAVGLGALTVGSPPASAVTPTIAYDVLDMATNDIVYDASRNLILASIPGSDPANGNSLVSMSPTTGALGAPTFVGSEPGTLAFSADYQFVYVGLNGSGSVAQVSMSTRQVTKTMPLGNGYQRPLIAEDIAVVPNDPQSIVVSKRDRDISPGFSGLVAFTQGTALAKTTPGHTGSNKIEFGTSSSTLYGYNRDSSAFGFYRNTVDATGVTSDTATPGLISGYSTDIVFAGGRLYSTTGAVINPATATTVGSFTLPGRGMTMAVDTTANRAYFVVWSSAASQAQLVAFDLTTFTLVKTWKIPEFAATSTATSLRVLSSGELIFRTDAEQFYFVDPNGQTGSAGEFTPVTPQRILDTRGGQRLGTKGHIDVQVTGVAGVPTSGVSAVVVNATVTGPTEAGYVTIYPTGHAVPNISSLNFVAGQTVPNLVTVALGAGGKVSAYNETGSTDILLDIAGFYTTASGPAGSRYVPVDPTRIVDTRSSQGGRRLNAKDTIPMQIVGAGGLPSSGVTAVALNVTVTGTTAPSFLTVFPNDVAKPGVSNLNFVGSQTVPNMVIVRVPASGIVNIANEAGSANVLVDVLGYYHVDDSNESGRFIAIDPERMIDTRSKSPFPGGRVPASGRLQVVTDDSLISAYVLNVTVVDPQGAGFVTLAPFPGAKPTASNLNFSKGQTVPNAVIVRIAPDFAIYNDGGNAHVIVDIFGGFTK